MEEKKKNSKNKNGRWTDKSRQRKKRGEGTGRPYPGRVGGEAGKEKEVSREKDTGYFKSFFLKVMAWFSLWIQDSGKKPSCWGLCGTLAKLPIRGGHVQREVYSWQVCGRFGAAPEAWGPFPGEDRCKLGMGKFTWESPGLAQEGWSHAGDTV